MKQRATNSLRIILRHNEGTCNWFIAYLKTEIVVAYNKKIISLRDASHHIRETKQTEDDDARVFSGVACNGSEKGEVAIK